MNSKVPAWEVRASWREPFMGYETLHECVWVVPGEYAKDWREAMACFIDNRFADRPQLIQEFTEFKVRALEVVR